MNKALVQEQCMLRIPVSHVLHWFKGERARKKRYEVDTFAANQRSFYENPDKTEN